MNKIKKKISEWIKFLFYGGMAVSAFGMIALYIIGVFCLPVVVIWAIYKIVTHFTN